MEQFDASTTAASPGDGTAEGGRDGPASRAWRLLKVAAVGYFLTRLLLLPARLLRRWLLDDVVDPAWIGDLLRAANLWVPVLVAGLLVMSEARRFEHDGPDEGDPSRSGHHRVRAWWATAGLFFGAAVPAEFLSSYLPETGDPGAQLGALVFFGPLYGGMAVLIREAAVRTGRGWPSMLAWSTAFGIAMPGLVDLSAFTRHQPEISFWDELWQPTELPALGTSAYPVLSFVLGHVVMSMAVPLAAFDGLFPRLRRRPLLNRWTTGILVVLFAVVAGLVRWEWAEQQVGVSASASQTAAVLVLVALALVVGWRRPPRRYLTVPDADWPALQPEPATHPGVGRSAPDWKMLTVVGFVALAGTDLLPATWLGLAGLIATTAGVGWLVLRWSRRAGWGPDRVAALAVGALIGRSLIGFLAPVPIGASTTGKYVQNVLLLAVVLTLSWLVLRRSGPGPAIIEHDRGAAGSPDSSIG